MTVKLKISIISGKVYYTNFVFYDFIPSKKAFDVFYIDYTLITSEKTVTVVCHYKNIFTSLSHYNG